MNQVSDASLAKLKEQQRIRKLNRRSKIKLISASCLNQMQDVPPKEDSKELEVPPITPLTPVPNRCEMNMSIASGVICTNYSATNCNSGVIYVNPNYEESASRKVPFERLAKQKNLVPHYWDKRFEKRIDQTAIHADDEQVKKPWLVGIQNSASVAMGGNPIHASKRYGYYGAFELSRRMNDRNRTLNLNVIENELMCKHVNERLSLKDLHFMQIDSWEKRLEAGPTLDRHGPFNGTPKLWPSQAVYPTGSILKVEEEYGINQSQNKESCKDTQLQSAHRVESTAKESDKRNSWNNNDYVGSLRVPSDEVSDTYLPSTAKVQNMFLKQQQQLGVLTPRLQCVVNREKEIWSKLIQQAITEKENANVARKFKKKSCVNSGLRSPPAMHLSGHRSNKFKAPVFCLR